MVNFSMLYQTNSCDSLRKWSDCRVVPLANLDCDCNFFPVLLDTRCKAKLLLPLPLPLAMKIAAAREEQFKN